MCARYTCVCARRLGEAWAAVGKSCRRTAQRHMEHLLAQVERPGAWNDGKQVGAMLCQCHVHCLITVHDERMAAVPGSMRLYSRKRTAANACLTAESHWLRKPPQTYGFSGLRDR